MPSLSPKDRVSLCLFSYEDGRRCRTPRIGSHPHFCFYHAQKESQSQSTEKLAKDMAYFFSGDYLSANDLNAALGRLIPAVIRGEIKTRVARTVAYMLQTLMQSSRQAQHEYINAFSTDTWRNTIAKSVNANHAHLHPPKPKQPTQSPARPAPTTQTPPPPPQQPAAAPPPTPPPTRPSPADTEAALNAARSIFPPRPNNAPSPAPPPQPPSPKRDPFEVHFDHTQLRIDGKPW
jgi:hypothetical protein